MMIASSSPAVQEALREGRRQRSLAFLSLFRRTKPNPEPARPGCDAATA